VGDDSHFVFRQKLLGEDGNVRRGVVVVKQPGLFSPKFEATSWHVYKQSPQNVAVEPGIHSLACWNQWRIEGVGFGGFPTTPLNFRRFVKPEPNSQFRGKYIHNNQITIRASLICNLSGTPDWGATARRSPFSLPSVLT
jgi:hypothetical protein